MADPEDEDNKKKAKNVPPPSSITAIVKTGQSPSSDATVPTYYPPVEASARRLERLFGGGGPTTTTTTTSTTTSTSTAGGPASLPPPPTSSSSHHHHHAVQNRSKITKKWLGSSSGASASATLASIACCAERVLDPYGPCATGRELLLGLCVDEGERRAVLLSSKSKSTTGGVGGGEMKKKAMEEGGGEEEAMDEDATPSPPLDYLSKSAREVESWLVSLAIRVLWRSGDHVSAYEWTTRGMGIIDAHLADSASSSSSSTTNTPDGVGGLYPLLARLLRYRSLVIESFPPGTRSGLVAYHRSELAGRHTTAVLRRDADVSATALNVMLRDLLLGDQVEQAQKLLSNATFPTESASNNQLVRYLYYSGRVQALRLEYTQAYSNLGQALRKCPTNAGLGFRIAVQRLLVVVQLLMGEVPDRSVFFGEGTRAELRPYLEIAQAVRRGDLAVFRSAVSAHADRLRIDGTHTLISRLAHSVVKAGLRRLKTSYSRISLDDVAHRLGLPSSISAEFVVAKAVRDGVIDATIDHEMRYIQSHDLVDVYATVEPSEAFHRRIAYCLTTHNDAVRAMRYTPDAYKKQLEASRGLGRRGRGDDDDKTDEEKAKEIEDELDEDY